MEHTQLCPPRQGKSQGSQKEQMGGGVPATTAASAAPTARKCWLPLRGGLAHIHIVCIPISCLGPINFSRHLARKKFQAHFLKPDIYFFVLSS